MGIEKPTKGAAVAEDADRAALSEIAVQHTHRPTDDAFSRGGTLEILAVCLFPVCC